MKILIDECLPAGLKKEFVGFDVYTVYDLGWSGKKDKDLLAEASLNKFDVFITVDKGVEKQINITKYDLSVITIEVPKNILKYLVPSVNSIKEDIQKLEKNNFYQIKTGSKLTRIN